MAAYTELQEKEFTAEQDGYGAVKHQAFVGAGYFDEITSICGQSSTQALPDSTEEEQFHGNGLGREGVKPLSMNGAS